MVLQAPHLIKHLIGNIGHKRFIGWVHGIGKHKILPYQYAVAVAQVVKNIFLIDTTTPHTQHIDARLLHGLQALPVKGVGHGSRQHAQGCPVGSFYHNRPVVYFKIKGATDAIRLLHQLNGTHPQLVDLVLQLSAIGCNGYRYAI